MRRNRRVKIVATLGPASNNETTIRGLFQAGADVFRINMSHATPEILLEAHSIIRKLEKEFSRPIGILIAILLTSGLRGADGVAPGRQHRLAAAVRQIRQKDYDAAQETLLALEKEKGLDDAARAQVYQQMMALAAATKDPDGKTQAAERLLALRGAAPEQRSEALAHLAESTDFGARYVARYVEMKSSWPV